MSPVISHPWSTASYSEVRSPDSISPDQYAVPKADLAGPTSGCLYYIAFTRKAEDCRGGRHISLHKGYYKAPGGAQNKVCFQPMGTVM